MDFDVFKKNKQENKKFTNCYLSNDDLQERFSNNEFETFQTQSHALLMLEKTRYAFYKLLFFSKDILKVNWNTFSDKKLVLNMLLRRSKLDEWSSIINKIQQEGKFTFRGKFLRMSLVLSESGLKKESSKIIKNPEHSDLNEIQKLLEHNFDIYTEFIPSISDLTDFIDTTYIIKENDKIAAFAICQNIGNTTELRFLLVLKEHRKKGFGNLLLKHSITINENISRYFLWVNIENNAAINLYNKMKFKEDDLLNCLFINNNIIL
jgi:ribosomal protein S18 acetylase RimI-like enzyme